jgi:hypothetical protein
MASAQEKTTACCLPARDAAGARRAIAVAGKVSMAAAGGGERVVSAAGGGAVMEDIAAAVQPATAKASSKGIRGSRIATLLSHYLSIEFVHGLFAVYCRKRAWLIGPRETSAMRQKQG